MPSKVKKASEKKTSKSTANRSPSSRSPATPFGESEGAGAAANELFNRRVLSGAASRFPHLMSESPLCRVVSDVGASSPNDNYARVWLSEGFSLQPGSLVSVALAASEIQHLDILPLYNSVGYNCGFDAGDSFLDEVGCYFAIATVLFCSKVQKNGVRLSRSLSCTMGSPAIGQLLFISPVGDSSSCHNESRRNSACPFHLHKCKNLKLKILPITSRSSLPMNISPIEVASISSEYEKAKLPKTPSFHSKLPSTVTSPLHMENFHCSSPCLDASALNFVLNDEGSKVLYEKFVSLWLRGRFLLKGNLINVPICGTNYLAYVEGVDELTTNFASQDSSSEGKNNVLLIEARTRIFLSIFTATGRESSSERVFPVENKTGCISEMKPNDISRLGGLSKEFSTLKEIIKYSFEYKDPSGVLIHGPPGTGKTTLVLCCARDAGASLFLVNGREIASELYGESEQALENIFDSARKAAPAVVFIDKLDVIAPTQKAGGEELFFKMARTLVKLMDDIKGSLAIVVIAATNRPDIIDPSVRRHHIFNQEIEIGVPSPAERLEILHTFLDEMDHSLSSSYMESLAFEAHGFVGADLAILCREALLTALRRSSSSSRLKLSERLLKGSHSKNDSGDDTDLNSLSSILSELTIAPSSVSPESNLCFPESNIKYHSYDSYGANQKVLPKVTVEDFEVAKKKVRPSAMHEVVLKLPKVCWEDVGGQREVKRQLIEAVQRPQENPDAFKRIGIKPPRGLLMIGPPGCSKTMLARVVASEAKLNFLAVKGPELFSKWVGDSEKAVRSIFEKAKANSPAIIFFDEIDGLAVTRGAEHDGTSVGDRVVSQLLVEMDGIDQRGNVVVIAATNRPDRIDPAFLRPGRFDRILNVLPPNESDREDIFRIYTRSVPCCHDVSVKELARLTEGYTGADIKLVCHMAKIAALEESLEASEVSMEHFRTGVRNVHPSDITFFQEIVEKFWRRVRDGSG